MGKHVMIDLETWGTNNKAIIISLGAVKFDPMTDEDLTVDNFYCAIDPKSSQDYGLKVDANTIMWWIDPKNDEARAKWLGEVKVDLASTLEGFQDWYGGESLPTWGNGATFDNVLLRNAYDCVGLECPWKFWHDRCFRTLKNLTKLEDALPTFGVAHHALTDALNQAQHLRAVVRKLGITLE
jgi:exodeoxyribonuclease VIII